MQNFSKGNLFKLGVKWETVIKRAFLTENWPCFKNGE